MDFAAALPLARSVLDRAVDLRSDPDVLTRARRDPATRVLVVGGGEIVVGESGAAALLDPATAGRVAGDDEQLAWDDERRSAAQAGSSAQAAAGHDYEVAATHDDEVTSARDGEVAAARDGEAMVARDGEVMTAAYDDEAWLLLGRDGDDEFAPLVLARRVRHDRHVPRVGQPSDVLVHGPVDEPTAADLVVPGNGTDPSRGDVDPAPPSLVPAPGLRWTALREAGADLPARDAGLATMAVALDEWHTRHPRCPRCGAPTVPAQAGWVRVCTVDGSEHYPRTDPAIIVAVVDDDDRLLLGHNAAWPEGRFSTLAGFVEAGESAEHAVAREVAEETAVVVDGVDYRGSQPWPFPASLMLAYRGHAATTAVKVDGAEVTEARWFTRDELAVATQTGEVLLPMRTSVAYALITDWFGAPLPTRW